MTTHATIVAAAVVTEADPMVAAMTEADVAVTAAVAVEADPMVDMIVADAAVAMIAVAVEPDASRIPITEVRALEAPVGAASIAIPRARETTTRDKGNPMSG
jgi:hypothetical protein